MGLHDVAQALQRIGFGRGAYGETSFDIADVLGHQLHGAGAISDFTAATISPCSAQDWVASCVDW